MKETLTDEYFAKQTIKNQNAHQRLREMLKNLDCFFLFCKKVLYLRRNLKCK